MDDERNIGNGSGRRARGAESTLSGSVCGCGGGHCYTARSAAARDMTTRGGHFFAGRDATTRTIVSRLMTPSRVTRLMQQRDLLCGIAALPANAPRRTSCNSTTWSGARKKEEREKEGRPRRRGDRESDREREGGNRERDTEREGGTRRAGTAKATEKEKAARNGPERESRAGQERTSGGRSGAQTKGCRAPPRAEGRHGAPRRVKPRVDLGRSTVSRERAHERPSTSAATQRACSVDRSPIAAWRADDFREPHEMTVWSAESVSARACGAHRRVVCVRARAIFVRVCMRVSGRMSEDDVRRASRFVRERERDAAHRSSSALTPPGSDPYLDQ